MTADVYAELLHAWETRMRWIRLKQPGEAQTVWGDAYRKYYGDDPTRIEWKFRDDGGADCVVAGTMFFEDTATALVRVPK